MAAVLGALQETHQYIGSNITNSCSDIILSDGNCTFGPVHLLINKTSPCIFNCSYNIFQNNPHIVRLEVILGYKHPMKHPTFVSAQQSFYLNSWTLPIMFPVHGDQQKYTTVDELLCPPLSSSQDSVVFNIATENEALVNISFQLSNVSYVIKKEENVSLTVSPVSAWYKLYQWDEEETSVLVTAESSKPSSKYVCGILGLQNAKCPVDTDVSGLRSGRGRYQTFTTRAGMIARKQDFPDGIHIVILSLPDDGPCSLNIGSESNKTVRKKTAVLQLFTHATIWSTWYIFFLTAVVLAIFVSLLTKGALMIIERTLASGDEDDDEIGSMNSALTDDFKGGRLRVEDEAFLIGTASDSNPSRPPNLDTLSSEDGRYDTREEARGELGDISEGVFSLPSTSSHAEEATPGDTVLTIEAQPFAPPTTYAPPPAVMNFRANFNPRFVLWWKRVAFFEGEKAESKVEEIGFQNNLVITALFAALPVTELIRSYLLMMRNYGIEDQCFYNSRCLTGFGAIPDFSRFFSNIAYIFVGIAFTIIVKKHRRLTYNILIKFNPNDNVGVSRHYGLFTSLGYGLIIEGIMSSLYHLCPNTVTIRFDMMYMYVVMVVAVVTMWGLRHGDVAHHVYPTIFFVGMTLLMAEGQNWINPNVFWSTVSVIYLFILVTNAVLLARYGIWSFSPYRMYHECKGWKPVIDRLDQVLRDEDRTSRPIHILRVVVGCLSNLTLIIYGFVMDPDIYIFILIVCISNTGLYFGNYMITKRFCCGEKGTRLAWVFLLLSAVLWILALVVFSIRNTNTETSPSSSRALNNRCDFLTVYDTHDVWHVTSAFALFTFFVGLLTLDDDLCHTASRNIYVF